MKDASVTSILVGAENEVFIVDISDDHKRVIVTSPWQREEGSPESAVAFAQRLYHCHGRIVEEFCKAVYRAADKCFKDREAREPKPS
jgi:hypothetical protein